MGAVAERNVPLKEELDGKMTPARIVTTQKERKVKPRLNLLSFSLSLFAALFLPIATHKATR